MKPPLGLEATEAGHDVVVYCVTPGGNAAVDVVGEPRVMPSVAFSFTVMAEFWLPPTRASVPALTVVSPL